jgi:hypothetical protein
MDFVNIRFFWREREILNLGADIAKQCGRDQIVNDAMLIPEMAILVFLAARNDELDCARFGLGVPLFELV